jgi:hypothetical protein
MESKELLLEQYQFQEPWLVNQPGLNPTFCCQIYITHHSTHHIEWFLMFWGPYYDSHKKVEWREPAVGETLNFNHFL